MKIRREKPGAINAAHAGGCVGKRRMIRLDE